MDHSQKYGRLKLIKVNIKSTKPETVEEGTQYTHEENKVSQTKIIKIIQSKPELLDTEIQH